MPNSASFHFSETPFLKAEIVFNASIRTAPVTRSWSMERIESRNDRRSWSCLNTNHYMCNLELDSPCVFFRILQYHPHLRRLDPAPRPIWVSSRWPPKVTWGRIFLFHQVDLTIFCDFVYTTKSSQFSSQNEEENRIRRTLVRMRCKSGKTVEHVSSYSSAKKCSTTGLIWSR